jgi:hypothetical protein
MIDGTKGEENTQQSKHKRVKEHKAKEKVPAHRGWSSHHQTPPKRKDRDMGLHRIPMSTFRSESKVKTHSIPFKSSVTHLLVAHEKEVLLRMGKKSVILQNQGSRKSDQPSSDLIRMMISCSKLHILVHFLQSYRMLWLLQV